jgi:Asp-tRNA(Asn)/Glu-tRNA(Gln) amidotransferase A subunit family amidase
MTPLALGSDAGGSIRGPAAVCGIVGYKPTHGLVPRTPGFDEMRTTNVFGPLTRTVRDAALALSVLAGPDPSDDLCLPWHPVDFAAALNDADITGLHMAWTPGVGSLETADASLQAVVAAAIDLLERDGWRLDCVDPATPDIGALGYPTWLGELGNLAGGRELLLTGLGRDLVADWRRLSAEDHYTAQLERARFTAAWDRFFADYDVVLLPAVTFFGSELSSLQPRSAAEVGSAAGALGIANLTRRPAISVPIGRTEDGLPVALEVMAARGCDATCLAVAAAIERLAPWERVAHLDAGQPPA